MSFVRYKVKEKEVADVDFGMTFESKRVVIMEEYTNDLGVSIEVPSCLNKLLVKFKNKSINNAKNLANVICPFLNFVKLYAIEEDDPQFDVLIEKGLYGLNFYHAARYLNYCIEVKRVKESAAMQYTDQILDFYGKLLDYGLLDSSDVKINYTLVNIKGTTKRKRCKENPFDKPPYEVCYPSKVNPKLTKIVNLEEHLWQLFLRISEAYAPDITLGIAFQMFGGLRRGEVVNLALQDIKLARTTDITKINLKIQNRQAEFFGDRKDVELSKCGVKNPRPQEVFNFNSRLYKYYRNHLELRNKILDKSRKVTTALFVDEDGLPMSGTRFEQRWAKVKREFLKSLELDVYNYYDELSKDNAIWGTHIGRGIFTNLCLTYGLAKTVRELANLRGDRHVDSSQPYIDKFNKAKIITKTLNVISDEMGI